MKTLKPIIGIFLLSLLLAIPLGFTAQAKGDTFIHGFLGLYVVLVVLTLVVGFVLLVIKYFFE